MPSKQTIIFHIDGDAFFASCEQSTNLSLRDRPIVVGRDRGIATAYSYEAKRMGVERGMSIKEIQEKYPGVSVVSSDYRKYGIFSQRMKRIVAGYTKYMDGDSIDECYADMSGPSETLSESMIQAKKMQHEINTKLGLTVSIGVGPSKTIAKIASGLNKPCGITVLGFEVEDINLYNLPIEKVSGIGARTAPKMNQKGIHTIGDLCRKNSVWVEENFSKPYVELYRGLLGFQTEKFMSIQELPKSISKIRAFEKPTKSLDFIKSEMIHNAEIVARKMHQNSLEATQLTIGMKMPMKGPVSLKIRPTKPISNTQDIVSLIKEGLPRIFQENTLYRATFVDLNGLRSKSTQSSLWENSEKEKAHTNNIESVVNGVGEKHGKTILHRASSLLSVQKNTALKTEHTQDSPGTPLVYSSDGIRILKIPLISLR